MARAIAPKEIPGLPEGATEWRRSTRAGSMFHAHALGVPVCGAKVMLERFSSRAADNLGDLQYWGCCPRCFAKVPKPKEPGDFERAWAKKEAEGYLYGPDALENVRLGWDMAQEFHKPAPVKVERNAFGYDGAAHIFNWARNDQRLYRKMLHVRSTANFINDSGQAQAALLLASETVREGKNDISRQLLEPSDYLRAALMFLSWDGES